MDERIIISQTFSPKNYCKHEHTMCEFANDRGYCIKTGCSKRIIINDKPIVNHNLVEVVRCKDCKYSIDYYEDGECYCKRPGRALDYRGQKWDGYCDAGERE